MFVSAYGEWIFWLDQPCGSYYDCKMSSIISIRKLWKRQGLLLTVLDSTWHTWSHPVKSGLGGGGGEWEWVHGSWVLLLFGSEGGSLSFAGSLFIGSLKYKTGNLKHRKRKNKWPKWYVNEINQDLFTKEPRGLGLGGGWMALYLVLWLAMCLFEITIFKVDALGNQGN